MSTFVAYTALAFFISRFIFSQAYISEHEVFSIPGAEFLPSRTFRGYIGIANNTRFLNYMFFEAQSDPKNAPVTLWMQGGPGASGFLGLFTEIGPFNFRNLPDFPEGTLPKLSYNEYTWIKESNFLFFESPAAVGFSYCADSCPHYNDTIAAQDNYEFLINFFEAYPEFSQNDFYLSGESYAGIYIPTLAHEIMTQENDINLKGVLVGNGCVGLETNGGCSDFQFWIMIDFLHSHGQISTKTYEAAQENCPGNDFSSDICKKISQDIYYEAGKFNYYNYYDECMAIEEATKNSNYQDWSIARSYDSYDYPCFQEYSLDKWANHPDVIKFFNQSKDTKWSEINYSDFYTRTEPDVFPYYQEMMSKGIKILIYFGDIDIDVPYNGGEQWITSLGMNLTETWRPWTITDENQPQTSDYSQSQTAGYLMTYEKKMTYLTIRGAGHMVPQTKPKQAYDMFRIFINDMQFPYYNQ